MIRRNRRGGVTVIQSGGRGSYRPEDEQDLNGAHRIHIAAYCGLCQEVKELIDSNSVRIGVKERSGREALHYAALGGHCDIIAALLERGAKVKAEDTCKMHPLYYAAAHGHCDALELLLKYRADAEHRGRGNITMLHEAAGGGHVRAVALLLEHRASADARDSRGVSPLYLATCKKQRGTVSILKDASEAVSCSAKALKERKSGKMESALHHYNLARKALGEWPLPRMKAEISWEAAACELFLQQFAQCMKSCNVALQGNPAPIDPELVRLRLREAFAGHQRQEELKKLAAVEELKEAVVANCTDSFPDHAENVDFLETTSEVDNKGDAAEAATMELLSSDSASPSSTSPATGTFGDSNAPEEADHAGAPERVKEAPSHQAPDIDQPDADAAGCDEGPDETPTCVVCLSEQAVFVGKVCGHLAWCAACRRKAVHLSLGGQGSKAKHHLSSTQLDRVPVACPVCREEGCIVRFKGRAWRRAPVSGDVYVPLA